jgi:hypothetical protein
MVAARSGSEPPAGTTAAGTTPGDVADAAIPDVTGVAVDEDTGDGADDPAAGPATRGPAAPAAAVVAAGPTATTPVAGVAESPPASAPQPPVLDQVAPVLSRVVSRGDGEHRMMLKLHPADLGEVHLTVTVRGDQVDVEIAAGSEARELLRDGAGQLRSLLESIGRTSGQLVLRDLPAPSAPTPLPGSTAGGPGPDGRATTSEHGGGQRDAQHGSRPPARDPRPAERLLGTDPVAPRVFGRSRVAGGPALDVTV